MNWRLSYRADPRSVPIADRHYNRQAVGSPQFVPPGRCLVLRAFDGGALWVSSFPFKAYCHHAWAGAWVNSLFRRETTPVLSSVLITEAVAATRWYWGNPPALGMVTFIDLNEIRHKRDPGRCYRKAGFKPCGYTKSGLLALQLLPHEMPIATKGIPGAQHRLFEEVA